MAKIAILRYIQNMRDNGFTPDFESAARDKINIGLLNSMIKDGLVQWGGIFSLTEKGDKLLRDYLIIELQSTVIKEKYMFDSNVFDDLVSGKINLEKIERYKQKTKAEFYITHIQIDEINSCSDKEKRSILFLFMTKIRPITIPTYSCVLDISRYENSRYSDGKLLEEFRKGNIEHTEDALIGETALKEDITLITNDKTLHKRLNEKGGKSFLVDDFINIISKI